MLAGLSLAMLEAGLRGAAVALLAVLAALLLRDGRRTPAGLYGAMFAASVAAYVIVTAPGLRGIVAPCPALARHGSDRLRLRAWAGAGGVSPLPCLAAGVRRARHSPSPGRPFRRSHRGAPPLSGGARAFFGDLHGSCDRAGNLHGRAAGLAAAEHRKRGGGVGADLRFRLYAVVAVGTWPADSGGAGRAARLSGRWLPAFRRRCDRRSGGGAARASPPADGAGEDLSRGRFEHHRALGPARGSGIPPAPAHQPAAGPSELQHLRQRLPSGRCHGGAGRPDPGSGADPDDRARCRVPVAWAVQSRLQGAYRHDAVRLSAPASRPARAAP